MCLLFFFNDTATTEIYTLSLHDALPISKIAAETLNDFRGAGGPAVAADAHDEVTALLAGVQAGDRSEEHTSELQSRRDLVCRLLLEKKKKLPNLHTGSSWSSDC